MKCDSKELQNKFQKLDTILSEYVAIQKRKR